MKKIKVGVLGGFRGNSMIRYCKHGKNAEVVAICDNNPDVLKTQKELHSELDIAFYDNFDEFIKHDMDAVVLANFATQHAPFAIKAMKAGKHVFSEVLPVQTMKEAVELVETVEETGKIYAYGENYCYMPAPYEMRKLYREGKIGEIEYAECEYAHNCEPVWPAIAYGDKNHWRNNMYSTFYCTHSLGPIIHITGLRPIKVTGFEPPVSERSLRVGRRNAEFGIEMVTLENGAIVKSLHGGLYRDNIWYFLSGDRGVIESVRKVTGGEEVKRLYFDADAYPGGYGTGTYKSYIPETAEDEIAKEFGHGGSDYYSMWHFIEKLRGKEDADIIDVYEALDMFLPGHFAYRSILAEGKSMDIPNLRNKEERDIWRNDVCCTDPAIAGDSLWPCNRGGNPDIDDAVYDRQKELLEKQRQEENGYFSWVFKK